MKNKNIIITGTSRGIGYELALQFANAGHQVLAISRKTPKELIENPNITCLSIDISNPEELLQVEKFISQTWKIVDVLIHNAGSLLHKQFTQITSADFQNIYKVNVFAVAELTKICIPFMEIRWFSSLFIKQRSCNYVIRIISRRIQRTRNCFQCFSTWSG